MEKSEIKTFLIGVLSAFGAFCLLQDIYFLFTRKKYSDEERFWESHPFEDPLEKADDFCEIGFTFQKNEIIYKKISGKKWFAEILRANAQKNRAKSSNCGHSSKPNPPSSSVYKKVLMSL